MKPLIIMAGLLSMNYCAIIPEALSQDDQTEAAGDGYEQILERDYRRMMEWLPGRYDNQEQAFFDERLSLPQDERHKRIHTIIREVSMPELPGRVFHLVEYQNDNPEEITREQILRFETDVSKRAIRQVSYTPAREEKLRSAIDDPTKLIQLADADLKRSQGCDVFWTYELDQYRGAMIQDACIHDESQGERLTTNETLQLSRNGYWRKTSITNEAGDLILGNKAGVPTKGTRAEVFNCWVAPRKHDGTYGFYNDVMIHDQGGRIWLDSDDHDRVGLRIRQVIWPMGNNRPSTVLYLHQGDDELAESYTWTSVDEPRIGINLRWIQASCTKGGTTITPGINLTTGSGQ